MKTRRIRYGLLISMLVLGLGTRPASAVINLVFSGTAGSPIIGYSISGSGTFSFGGTNSIIRVLNLTGDPFGVAFVSEMTYAVTGTGTLTNTSTSQSTTLSGITFDHAGMPGDAADDLRLDFVSNLTAVGGQSYTMSGSGTFDVSSKSATYSDFNPGSGAGVVSGSGLGVDGVVVTVPEPSRMLLAVAGIVVIAMRRRR